MKTTMRLLPLLLTFVSLLVVASRARAVSPPPDGGYPGGNTAEGQNAMLSLTSGGFNTAVGWFSLRSDMTGSYNTALGAGALVLNTADGNTATGVGALLNNTTGGFNTANGVLALFHNTGGEFNTAIGSFVLANNTTGTQNMAMGDSALLSNTTGSQNVAIGVSALRNSNGSYNIAIGQNALLENNSGFFNVAVGQGALANNNGDANTALGNNAGSSVTGTFNICIGSEVAGFAGESNTIRIGDNLPFNAGASACYIGGIFGQGVSVNGVPVYIDGNRKLGVSLSARRFKRDIQSMEKSSEAVLSLKPVRFRYKGDRQNTWCFGLVAEDVAEVNADLVIRDAEGKPLTVRYEAVNAMLLNEFLKEHRKVEQLEATVEELSSKLERVAARIEMNDSAARLAGK
jgi:trimeric autotransporter adhesin